MEKVRVGIIGIGNMGATHVRNIRQGKVPGLEVTALCDNKPERSEVFPGAAWFDRGEDLAASDSVDAVIVATHHYDHTSMGIAALRNGKHLLVEKPISAHKADALKLIEAHKDSSVIFSAMFNQRTDPRYIRLKKLIANGELGPVRRVVWNITTWYRTSSYYASGGWRATWDGEGGGVLLNQCPHQLDLWQWLFGMPDRLRAFCEYGRYHDIEVEDDVTCFMEYDSGCKGVFITSTGEAPGSNRLEVTAEKGRVIIDEEQPGLNWTRNEIPMSEWSRTSEGGFTKPPSREIHFPDEGTGEQHLGILRNFANAILKGDSLIAPAREGLHSVELANAMLYSSAMGATLELPLDAQAYSSWLGQQISNSPFRRVAGASRISSDFDQS